VTPTRSIATLAAALIVIQPRLARAQARLQPLSRLRRAPLLPGHSSGTTFVVAGTSTRSRA
jgi:hypothetical protein